jgi:hypothetical protein
LLPSDSKALLLPFGKESLPLERAQRDKGLLRKRLLLWKEPPLAPSCFATARPYFFPLGRSLFLWKEPKGKRWPASSFGKSPFSFGRSKGFVMQKN